MASQRPVNTDAYTMILDAIDIGTYRPGDRLVESELAERFGVTHVTVIRTIQRLERDGLVRTEPYKPVELPQKGDTLAAACRRRHEIVYRFLLAIGVPADVAAGDAEGIEHHVSDATLTRFREMTQRLR